MEAWAQLVSLEILGLFLRTFGITFLRVLSNAYEHVEIFVKMSSVGVSAATCTVRFFALLQMCRAEGTFYLFISPQTDVTYDEKRP